MSLSRKDKEALQQAIMRLARTINDLENTSVDPRVLDMLEICGSLLEQQIEMDIVFEQCEAGDLKNEIVMFKPEEQAAEGHEVVHIKFTEEEDKDIPSPEDLEKWYNLGDLNGYGEH
jgi:hypothetical protein